MTPEPHWLCPPSAGWTGRRLCTETQVPPAVGTRAPGRCNVQARTLTSALRLGWGAFSPPPDPCPPAPGRALPDRRKGGLQGGAWAPRAFRSRPGAPDSRTQVHPQGPPLCPERRGVPDLGPRAGSGLPSPRLFFPQSQLQRGSPICLFAAAPRRLPPDPDQGHQRWPVCRLTPGAGARGC